MYTKIRIPLGIFAVFLALSILISIKVNHKRPILKIVLHSSKLSGGESVAIYKRYFTGYLVSISMFSMECGKTLVVDSEINDQEYSNFLKQANLQTFHGDNYRLIGHQQSIPTDRIQIEYSQASGEVVVQEGRGELNVELSKAVNRLSLPFLHQNLQILGGR